MKTSYHSPTSLRMIKVGPYCGIIHEVDLAGRKHDTQIATQMQKWLV